MKPTKLEFDLGPNVHGQPIRLIVEFSNAGRPVFSIVQDAASQRDECNRLGGLTDEHLCKLAEAVKAIAR